MAKAKAKQPDDAPAQERDNTNRSKSLEVTDVEGSIRRGIRSRRTSKQDDEKSLIIINIVVGYQRNEIDEIWSYS